MKVKFDAFDLSRKARHLRIASFTHMKVKLAKRIEQYNKNASVLNKQTEDAIRVIISELNKNSLSGAINTVLSGLADDFDLVNRYERYHDGDSKTVSMRGLTPARSAESYVAAYYASMNDGADIEREIESLRCVLSALLSATMSIKGRSPEMEGFILQTIKEYDLEKNLKTLLKEFQLI